MEINNAIYTVLCQDPNKFYNLEQIQNKIYNQQLCEKLFLITQSLTKNQTTFIIECYNLFENFKNVEYTFINKNLYLRVIDTTLLSVIFDKKQHENDKQLYINFEYFIICAINYNLIDKINLNNYCYDDITFLEYIIYNMNISYLEYILNEWSIDVNTKIDKIKQIINKYETIDSDKKEYLYKYISKKLDESIYNDKHDIIINEIHNLKNSFENDIDKLDKKINKYKYDIYTIKLFLFVYLILFHSFVIYYIK
jgi:hypothetical protein